MEGLLLGIDAGASKSAAAIADSDGRLLATATGPAVALMGPPGSGRVSQPALPTPAQSRVLTELAGEVVARAGVTWSGVEQVAIGLNGIDFPDEWEAQHAAICAGMGLPRERTQVVNDAIVALWGATDVDRATIVQLGSAFTSAYRRAPGHEELFDPFDFSRLFDLRREVVPRVARMLDGRLDRTGLADRFLRHVGVADERTLAAALFRDPAARARLQTAGDVVAAAWAEGDPVAAEMMRSAAADLGVTVAAMANRLGPGPYVAAFGGGVLRRMPPEFHDLVQDELAERSPAATVTVARLPPEQGAIVMAAHRGGRVAGEVFQGLVESSDEESGRRVVR